MCFRMVESESMRSRRRSAVSHFAGGGSAEISRLCITPISQRPAFFAITKLTSPVGEIRVFGKDRSKCLGIVSIPGAHESIHDRADGGFICFCGLGHHQQWSEHDAKCDDSYHLSFRLTLTTQPLRSHPRLAAKYFSSKILRWCNSCPAMM